MKLGRYEIVRELGKGAMGIVYLAKDPLIGRLVALKTIRAGAHSDDEETKEFQERFRREAQAAGILNHPSIVTVHDIGQDDTAGSSFIAMEYVEGHNLKEVLAQGRALSFQQIGDLIAQVADALDFAHAKGIVHRDVKPANIILLDGNRAKITDFGIAKIASGAANLTSTGQFLGTPNYMAPEQIKGAPVDGRTDIFSLGICFYECLTRRKPFGGDSLTSISYKIVHEPFPPMREINRQIPEGFEQVIEVCLAKDPTKRYQRARDMVNSIRAVMRGEQPIRPAELVMSDETINTRERDKVPTLEIPFPDAIDMSVADAGVSTRPRAAASAAPAAAAAPVAPPPSPRPRVPRPPIALQFKKTLTNVRTLPLWRSQIPIAVFAGVIALFILGLAGAVAAIKSGEAVIPVVDTNAEMRRAREKTLREEGNELIRQGRIVDAREKFMQLQRLAPRSPYVAITMQKLDAIMRRDAVSRQQITQARVKFEEGVALYNAGKFPEAAERLQESFSLNPNSNETVEYLKLAQQQQDLQLRRDTTRAGRPPAQPPRQAATSPAGTTTRPASGGSAAQTASAQLTTVFAHKFTDGRIVVRAGADIVANETLFTERPARLFRRAQREPRQVSVTTPLPPKNADVQVWVTIPAANIAEHHVLQSVRFEPGSARRLVVRYDETARKFSYELN